MNSESPVSTVRTPAGRFVIDGRLRIAALASSSGMSPRSAVMVMLRLRL